jgi:hypothetical protein
MKVLLRSIETGMYYEDASKWTSDQTAAFDFEKTTRVVELVFSAHLTNVEMLLISEDPTFDLILPIDKKQASPLPLPSAESIHPDAHRDDAEELMHKPLTRNPL